MHSTLFRLEYSLHSSCTLHTYLYALFPPPTLCTTRLRTIHTTAKCTFHTCTSRVTLRTILTTTQCTLHTCTSRVNRQCIVCILPSIIGISTNSMWTFTNAMHLFTQTTCSYTPQYTAARIFNSILQNEFLNIPTWILYMISNGGIRRSFFCFLCSIFQHHSHTNSIFPHDFSSIPHEFFSTSTWIIHMYSNGGTRRSRPRMEASQMKRHEPLSCRGFSGLILQSRVV